LGDQLQDRQVITELIKQHLVHAKARMKKQADQHRSERQFEIGRKVFLKLQPYVQSSLAPRANQKLSFNYFNPFEILQKVGSVAYKLLLPPSSSIHPVFHVSQLKEAILDASQVSPSLPSDIDLLRVPEKVLQRRMITRGVRQVPQVLVQWSEWPASMATWEDLEDLSRRFPQAPAWGQAEFQEGGTVSTTTTNNEEEMQDGPRRSFRPRKPNSRVTGEDWVRA
jgi:hypothetical protein